MIVRLFGRLLGEPKLLLHPPANAAILEAALGQRQPQDDELLLGAPAKIVVRADADRFFEVAQSKIAGHDDEHAPCAVGLSPQTPAPVESARWIAPEVNDDKV